MSRVLIVEDEAHLAQGLQFNLEAEGHSVQVVSTCWQLASGPRKAAALSNSAPVGQFATQAPHWVQVSDSAYVWFMSTITRLRMPR